MFLILEAVITCYYFLNFLGWESPIDSQLLSSNPLGRERIFSNGACVASQTNTLSGGSPAQSELDDGEYDVDVEEN